MLVLGVEGVMLMVWVVACRHAGRSRVRFSNQEVLLFHQWTKGAAGN